MAESQQPTREETLDLLKTFNALEDGNLHSELLLFLAQTFGTTEDVDFAQKMLGLRDGERPLTREQREGIYAMHTKLFQQFSALMAQHGIGLNDLEFEQSDRGLPVAMGIEEAYVNLTEPVAAWLKRNLGQ